MTGLIYTIRHYLHRRSCGVCQRAYRERRYGHVRVLWR
jgi:hypothetical protein